MTKPFAMIAFVLFATPAFSRIVAESDTSMVTDGPECKILSQIVSDPILSNDMFDYLSGEVTIKYWCLYPDGNTRPVTGGDSVIFPTLEFDWAAQGWKTGGKLIAKRGPTGQAILEPHYIPIVWIDPEPDHIAFKIYLINDCPPEDPDCKAPPHSPVRGAPF